MLILAGAGKRDTPLAKQKTAKCVVVGDSIIRNVGAEHADMREECFPGIKSEQLHRVTQKRDIGSPETVIIHVGTNDFRKTRNLDALVAAEKRNLPNCRLALSGVPRCRDVSWRRIGGT
jgi:hypothetical protein